MFELHPQLHKDTVKIGEFALSDVLLMNDARYPWVILVPRQMHIREIHQLSEADQHVLISESSFVAEAMMHCFAAHKMNVAALGNMVPQLHLHHIARYDTDQCWPKPIWGVGEAVLYQAEQLTQRLMQLRQSLSARLI